MPRASSAPRHSGSQLVSSSYSVDDWRRLTKLPAEVMLVSISLERGCHRSVAEGLAGLDAIAAGRVYDSDLVRAVVAAIFAEPEEDRPTVGVGVVPGPRQVLADCRRANAILRSRADPADAAGYRHWVQQVAVRVFAATRASGRPGLPEELSRSGQEFLTDLVAALS